MTDWSTPDFSRSRAVLIGTSRYAELTPIAAAANSLDRMHGLLTGPLCGWPADRVEKVHNAKSPGDLPDRLVQLYYDVTDAALFYYVGHGQSDRQDRLCLGLVNTSQQEARRATTSLTFDAVRDALRASRAKVKIVILDCCSAGLALPRDGLQGGVDVIGLTAGAGAYTIAATRAYKAARFDTDPDNPVPYTYFTDGMAGVIETGVVGEPAVLTLGAVVERLVEELASAGKPVPAQNNVDQGRDFPFARNIAATTPTSGESRAIAVHGARLERGSKLLTAKDRQAFAMLRRGSFRRKSPARSQVDFIVSGIQKAVRAIKDMNGSQSARQAEFDDFAVKLATTLERGYSLSRDLMAAENPASDFDWGALTRGCQELADALAGHYGEASSRHLVATYLDIQSVDSMDPTGLSGMITVDLPWHLRRVHEAAERLLSQMPLDSAGEEG